MARNRNGTGTSNAALQEARELYNDKSDNIGTPELLASLEAAAVLTHGKAPGYRKVKDITIEVLDRTVRAFTGNSTEQEDGFHGSWPIDLKPRVLDTIARLCASIAGKKLELQPCTESIDFVEMRNGAGRRCGHTGPPRNSTPANDSIYVVAVIGAPCSGKSSSTAPTAAALRTHGFTVIIVPEAATAMLEKLGGYDPDWAGNDRHVQLQCSILEDQAQSEDSARSGAALRPEDPTVILVDSATLSGLAYCDKAQWTQVLTRCGKTARGLAATYDLVINMISLAEMGNGDQYDYGPGSSNDIRHHTPAQAREVAPRLTAAWAAHHQLTTIDATPDIADKQRKVVNTILTSMPDRLRERGAVRARAATTGQTSELAEMRAQLAKQQSRIIELETQPLGAAAEAEDRSIVDEAATAKAEVTARLKKMDRLQLFKCATSAGVAIDAAAGRDEAGLRSLLLQIWLQSKTQSPAGAAADIQLPISLKGTGFDELLQGQGVGDHTTKEHASQYKDIAPPSDISDATKKRIADFLDEPDAGTTADPEAKRQRLDGIHKQLAGMSYADKIAASGGGGLDWLKNLANPAGKSTGAAPDVTIPKPSSSGIENGGTPLPYHFAPKPKQSAADLIAAAAGTVKQTMELGSDGTVTFKKTGKVGTIATPAQYVIAANNMLLYLRYKGNVKNYTTELDYIQHNQYIARIMRYFERFNFSYVIEFDILFRQRLHEGQLINFLDTANGLFSEILMEKEEARLSSKPVRPTEPFKRDTGIKKTKDPISKDKGTKSRSSKHDWTHKEHNGKAICWNYQSGNCKDRKRRDGSQCDLQHVCAMCLKKGCTAASHE